MTSNGNKVTYKDLYNIIGEFRKENNAQFDEVKEMFNTFHKEEFVPVRDFVERAKAYWVLAAVVFYFLVDWAKSILFKGS